MKAKDLAILLLLTVAALLVHGYHSGVEDSEIYLTAVEHNLDPTLFPIGAQYFEYQARASLYVPLIASSIRVTHLPITWAIFLWHLLSIFLLLWALRRLSLLLFSNPHAQWAGVVLVAALLTIPIAGTALYPMDQYLNPRNLSAFAQIFAVAAVLERKYLRAIAFLLLAALLHPFMAVFALGYCLLLFLLEQNRSNYVQRQSCRSAFFLKKNATSWIFSGYAYSDFALRGPRTQLSRAVLIGLPLGTVFPPSNPAYHQIAVSHYYHYILRWHWYELIGAIIPIASFWFFSRWARTQQLPRLELATRAALLFGVLCLAAALIVSIPGSLESAARFQPMRGLFLLYLLFFLIVGALLGQYVLKGNASRWVLLFLPICVAMYVPQRLLFPASAHVEWPWVRSRNPWVEALQWVRDNTPKDAIFALGPDYLRIEGEDENGFRAIAQRSRLADAVKDSGVVSIFPDLAADWHTEVQAQAGWPSFQLPDFLRLKQNYGVSWVVLSQPTNLALDCPYENRAVKVCRLP